MYIVHILSILPYLFALHMCLKIVKSGLKRSPHALHLQSNLFRQYLFAVVCKGKGVNADNGQVDLCVADKYIKQVWGPEDKCIGQIVGSNTARISPARCVKRLCCSTLVCWNESVTL